MNCLTLEAQSVVIFGQSTWHISERSRVTGGLAWTDEEKTADLFTIVDSGTVSAQFTGWRNDHWIVSVWGKNLSDNQYAGLIAATFPVTSMDAYFLAPPRIYGATLRYDF